MKNYLVIQDDENNIDFIIVSDMDLPDMIDYVDKLERDFNEKNDTLWFGLYLREHLHPSMTYIDTKYIGNYIVY